MIVGVVWVSGKSKEALRKAPATQTAPKSQTIPTPPKGTAPSQTPVKKAILQTTPTTIISNTTISMPQSPSDISPLQGKLTISTIRQNAVANSEYVTVQASPKNTESITFTGLTLRSRSSLNREKIPTAWTLPYPGNVGNGESVRLRPGEKAHIISGRSPNGQSFQLNTCTGYFEQGMNFTPTLPLACPSPLSEPLPLPPNTLSDACYDYLKQLKRCAVPSAIVPVALKADGSCQAHLSSKINYNQCVTYHKDDPNFFRGDWHIYLGRSTRLWRDKHDTVELLDEGGNLIDMRSY